VGRNGGITSLACVKIQDGSNIADDRLRNVMQCMASISLSSGITVSIDAHYFQTWCDGCLPSARNLASKALVWDALFFEVRVISQHARHVRIGRFPTLSRSLCLLLLLYWLRFDRATFVRGR